MARGLPAFFAGAVLGAAVAIGGMLGAERLADDGTSSGDSVSEPVSEVESGDQRPNEPVSQEADEPASSTIDMRSPSNPYAGDPAPEVEHGSELTPADVGINYAGLSPEELTPHDGPIATTYDGQVIEGFDIVDGNIIVRHADVIVRGNRVHSGGKHHYSIARQGDTPNLLVEGNELIGASAAAWDWIWTARRNLIRHMPGDFMKGGLLIEENYADFFVRADGAHHDGIQISSSTNGEVVRNYIGATYVEDMGSLEPVTSGAEGLTASVFLKPDHGEIAGYRFIDNFFASHPDMHYTFRIEGATDIEVAGNIWGRGWGTGPVYITDAPGLRWEDNRDLGGSAVSP